MRAFAFGAVIIACFASPVVHAAGFRFIDIPADASGPALTGAVWSPCAAPTREIKLRFVTFPAVQDCPIVGDRLPLIVLSHGSGGWFGAHRDTAAAAKILDGLLELGPGCLQVGRHAVELLGKLADFIV